MCKKYKGDLFGRDIKIAKNDKKKYGMKDNKKTWNIKKLDKEKRVCLFGDEFEMNVHQEYTQANCLLECAMEYSISIVSLKTEL